MSLNRHTSPGARTALALALCLGASSARAGDGTAELSRVVLQSPAVRAAHLRWQAAQQRQPAAGRLPDPELEGMVSRKSAAAEDIPMWEVSLRQPLPKAGERAAERSRAGAQTDMAEAEFLARAGSTAAEAAMQLAALASARERQRLLEEQRARSEQTLAALDARIASGQGSSAERLAVESMVVDLQLRVAREQQMLGDAESALRAWLGLAADGPLPAYAAPDVADIDAGQSPAVRQALAGEREAAAMASMARASGRPMTAVGLSFEREQMEEGDEDTVGVAFMTELPWRSRGAARAEVAAARSDEVASRLEAEAEQRGIQSLLEAVRRAEALAGTTRDLGARTADRLQAELEGLLRNAGTGAMNAGSPALMLVEILERQTDVRMRIVEAEEAARIARARLWQHAPARLLNPTGESP